MSTVITPTSPAETLAARLEAARAQKSTLIDEAENRFLKLLTTQLKNQDPLNPLDNAQLTSQLAQISTVNGIEKLNATLEKLLAGFAEVQAMEAAALVNRGVLVPGNQLSLGEQGGVAGLELSLPADAVTVTISDGQGLVLRRLELGALPAGIHSFVWDGRTDSGAQAVPGAYRFSVSAQSGTNALAATGLAFGLVEAVTRSSSGLVLDLGTLGAHPVGAVKQIL